MDTELIEQFFIRVTPANKKDCWLWKGSRNAADYGRIKFKQKHFAAHRLSYLIHKGPIKRGLVVCHECDNPPCVNPNHLWLGTTGQNQRDCTSKGRRAKGKRHRSHLYPNSVPRGEKHAKSKLTECDVRQIRQLGKTMSQDKIAPLFNVSQNAISNVLRGKTWSHVI